MKNWFGKLHRRDERADLERDLDDEIRFHLDEETRQLADAGAAPEEARELARKAFGSASIWREHTREIWVNRAAETFVQDLRLGIRLLARHRVFAIFSIVSLALGIGGTTAVFSLYDAIVLRKLPVVRPDELVGLAIQRSGRSPNSFLPYPQFEAMHASAKSLEAIFARTTISPLSVGHNGLDSIGAGVAVTGDYHHSLGVQPALGRLLTPEDNRRDSPSVAVISYGYWQRRFGSSKSTIGETITLNQIPFSVVGVEPAGFFGVSVGAAPDVTIPFQALRLLSGKEPPFLNAFSTWIEVMGRLRSGVSIDQARDELNTIFRNVSLDAARSSSPDSDNARLARETNLLVRPAATGGLSALRNNYERGLRLLLMLLGGVLSLASLNVGALLVSRSESRRNEITTRLALGAGRIRIVRQLLTESLVIAACGGVLGLALAWRGSELLLRLATSNSGALPIDLTPDLRIALFTVVVSTLSCLLFGLLPALRSTAASSVQIRAGLGSPRSRLLDRSLVVSQTALAVILVVIAGLFLRSLQKLWTQDTGYDRRNVLMFSVDVGLIGKRTEAHRIYKGILEELRSIPGAAAVSVSTVRPVSDTYYLIDRVTQVGEKTLPSEGDIKIAFNNIGPQYFDVMGIPLVAGRDFDERDTELSPKVVIVSEMLARHFNGNAIGQTLRIGKDDAREVVGIAKDSRYARVREVPREVAYLPFFQKVPGFTPSFDVRYAGPAADVLRGASEAVARVDQSLALFRTKTLDAQTQESFARERLLALMTSYFGLFAWLLAGIGLYGLLACTVVQRTREFGLRLALGAPPSGIGWTMMRETASTVIAGLALGMAATFAVVRLLGSQLYEVEPFDPLALIAGVLALLVLASIASLIPAIRAARIDPMTALRHD